MMTDTEIDTYMTGLKRPTTYDLTRLQNGLNEFDYWDIIEEITLLLMTTFKSWGTGERPHEYDYQEIQFDIIRNLLLLQTNKLLTDMGDKEKHKIPQLPPLQSPRIQNFIDHIQGSFLDHLQDGEYTDEELDERLDIMTHDILGYRNEGKTSLSNNELDRMIYLLTRLKK